MKLVVSEGRTSPHPIIGRFGSSRVIMKPATAGRGILASGPVRAVMEAAGIADVSAQTPGSNNPHNVLKAPLQALYELHSFDEIATRRGVPGERLRPAKAAAGGAAAGQ